MKSYVREYGLVVVVVILGMVAYAFVRENKKDLLDGSLGTIRGRLVAMVDDVPGREAVARHFDRFQEKVMAQEVSPEEVENIAANVLNLSNSGSTLTPEQAELMLAFASAPAEATLMPVAMADDGAPAAPPAAPVAPAPVTPPTPIDPTTLDALAERLESMIAFDVEVHKAMADRRDMARHIRYRVDKGLHIDIDAEMATAMTQRLASRVERLEKRKMIVWKQNMAEEMHADRERARHELRSVEALKKHPPRSVRVAMRPLESLKHLETLGYRPLLSDSLKQQITVHLEAALAGLGAQPDGVPANQEDLIEDLIEEHLDAVEGLFDAIEDSLDVLEEQDDDEQQ